MQTTQHNYCEIIQHTNLPTQLYLQFYSENTYNRNHKCLKKIYYKKVQTVDYKNNKIRLKQLYKDYPSLPMKR